MIIAEKNSISIADISNYYEYLLEYYKINGFDEAKSQINSGFKKEVYNDEILKKWIEEEK